MKTNLSSQITLTRIPLRYYRPENAFEHSVLTRLEKIPTNIYESAEEGSFAIAKEIATQIRKKQDIGKPFVFNISGYSKGTYIITITTPRGTYLSGLFRIE